MSENFEPKIVGFFCNWCTAAAADLAGTSRIQYPANVRPIRVMCSGSVDASYVIKALLEGADGVLIGGCHPGDCHYVNGNYKARRRVALLNSIFNTLKLDPERVWLRWISASEGLRFAKVIRQMTEELSQKGPNPMGKSPQT
ncbi:methyl-viologen-reducing hydrogenase subunit delta [candidate division TA06 bacterium B3_TA06]|uniref:Methyl-viologen-reducing hydrogenase subunit delta n=1 Tax=candidate division TA06 bacterium B3_TA06 TaxID=2012487 RepID=A0A532V2J1_UNCT6|nr:MAG: methyl-viologen-reducing hydrogenase subunit delta [candidate division TA06 bacterium B3_TA06]